MYSKNDGWIYFDSIEEAKGYYNTDKCYKDCLLMEEVWWLCLCGKWSTCGLLSFDGDVDHYRRKLTYEFKVRTEFKPGDPVCWCGCNGEVTYVTDHEYLSDFPVHCKFPAIDRDVIMFTKAGLLWLTHKTPSLFHGHDVLRAEDQKLPVEVVEKVEKVESDFDMMFDEAVKKAMKDAVAATLLSIREATTCQSCTFSIDACPQIISCKVHNTNKAYNDRCIAWQKKEAK